VQLELDQIPQLMSLIKQLEQEYFSSQKDKKDMLAILCLQLLQFLKRQFPQTENNAFEEYLPNRFKKLVEQHHLEMNAVSEYADLLAVTAGHLNDMVKKATGKSAKMIISEHVTLEAKRLLYHSQLSIKEIASQLNFEESSYFIRFFRKQTGLTPIAFRNNIREKYH
jgi:AraC-like DNA-binding protein